MFIRVTDATKKYGTGEAEIAALNNASLEVGKGEICVILGPSGSGKSTLLNMLGGLDTLSSGSIEVDTSLITSMKKKQLLLYRRNSVGFVFQFYNLIPDLTAKENIEVVAVISESPLSIDEVLEALEICPLASRFPKELSGGQQQRVAIGRALIKNPKLLLCDELTGALDSKSSKTVLRFVEIVNKKFGTTIVIVTHNENIQRMAHRIIRFKDGSVVTNEVNTSRISAGDIEL